MTDSTDTETAARTSETERDTRVPVLQAKGLTKR